MLDDKEHIYEDGFPNLRGMTVLPWLGWFLILTAVIGGLWALPARAEPIAQAVVNNGQIVITVFDEECTHLEHVTNLPKRATWKQDGKVYDGCVGANPDAGVLVFWFTDLTVAIVPVQIFTRLMGA